MIVGYCDSCNSFIYHMIDEPIASCDCSSSEWYDFDVPVWLEAKAWNTIESYKNPLRSANLNRLVREELEHELAHLKELVGRSGKLVEPTTTNPIIWQTWKLVNEDKATSKDVKEQIGLASTIDLLMMVNEIRFELQLAKEANANLALQLMLQKEG